MASICMTDHVLTIDVGGVDVVDTPIGRPLGQEGFLVDQ